MNRLISNFARIAGKPRVRIHTPPPRPGQTHIVARPLVREAALPTHLRPDVQYRDWAAI